MNKILLSTLFVFLMYIEPVKGFMVNHMGCNGDECGWCTDSGGDCSCEKGPHVCAAKKTIVDNGDGTVTETTDYYNAPITSDSSTAQIIRNEVEKRDSNTNLETKNVTEYENNKVVREYTSVARPKSCGEGCTTSDILNMSEIVYKDGQESIITTGIGKDIYNENNEKIGYQYDENTKDSSGNSMYSTHDISKDIFDEDGFKIGSEEKGEEIFYSADGTGFGQEFMVEKDIDDNSINENYSFVQYSHDTDGNLLKSVIAFDEETMEIDEISGNIILTGIQYDVDNKPIEGSISKMVANESMTDFKFYNGYLDENGSFIVASETAYQMNPETDNVYDTFSKTYERIYDKNGNYKLYDGYGKMLGNYNSDGDLLADSSVEQTHIIRRIYTVNEAIEALGKNNKNTFSIRYR